MIEPAKRPDAAVTAYAGQFGRQVITRPDRLFRETRQRQFIIALQLKKPSVSTDAEVISAMLPG